MTWYAHTGPRRKETGKFHSHAQLGTKKSTGGQYRGWHFDFVAHQTGSGVRRTRYAVSIRDAQKNRVQYLRDFSSIQQATEAAQEWIDHTLGLGLPKPSPGVVGTIPTLPLQQTAQEK